MILIQIIGRTVLDKNHTLQLLFSSQIILLSLIILHQLSKTKILGRTFLMMKNVVLDMTSFFALASLIFFLFQTIESYMSPEIRTDEQKTDFGQSLRNILNSLSANRNFQEFKDPHG